MHKAGLFFFKFCLELAGKRFPWDLEHRYRETGWGYQTCSNGNKSQNSSSQIFLISLDPSHGSSTSCPCCSSLSHSWTYTCRGASHRVKPQLNTTAHGHHHCRVITRRHISILVTKRGRDVSSLWKTRRAIPPQRLGDHLCILPCQKETERHLGSSSKIKNVHL